MNVKKKKKKRGRGERYSNQNLRAQRRGSMDLVVGF